MRRKEQKELAVVEYMSAAALLAGGVELLRVDPPGAFERKCRIVFDDTGGKASGLLTEHLRGTLTVSSAEYAKHLENLKTRLFAARGRGGHDATKGGGAGKSARGGGRVERVGLLLCDFASVWDCFCVIPKTQNCFCVPYRRETEEKTEVRTEERNRSTGGPVGLLRKNLHAGNGGA
jgi:hypothetical protein